MESLPHGHLVAACPQNRPGPRSFSTHGGVLAEIRSVAGEVESMRKTPVPAGDRRGSSESGSPRPVTVDDWDGVIIVDRGHDGNGLGRSVVGFEASPTDERVHRQVPVKRSLKLFCQVPLHKTSENCTVF